jgi:hypothetical protein
MPFKISLDVDPEAFTQFIDACQHREYSATKYPFEILALAAYFHARHVSKDVTDFIASHEDNLVVEEFYARVKWAGLIWPDERCQTERISYLTSKMKERPSSYCTNRLFCKLPIDTIRTVLALDACESLDWFFPCLIGALNEHGIVASTICTRANLEKLSVPNLVVLFKRRDFDWSSCPAALPKAIKNVMNAKQAEIEHLRHPG